jgi:hypothetical protein
MCIWAFHAHEIINFTKNLKNHAYSFDPTSFIYKILSQTYYILATIK